MRIAMIASESNPLCKTGGLADVVYSLSKQLAEDGEDVIVVLPFYSSIRDKGVRASYVGSYPVSLSWRHQNCDVYHCREGGVEFYLLDNHYYFGRSSLYGYLDDGERFAFFATAARGLFGYIGYQPDVIHCHDWQTGMIPCLVREQNAFDPTFAHAKFVFTIHNPAFKGIIDRYFLNDFYELSDELYFNGKVRFEGMVSTLKTGIVYSDYVTTVSPTHAKELLTEGHRLRRVGPPPRQADLRQLLILQRHLGQAEVPQKALRRGWLRGQGRAGLRAGVAANLPEGHRPRPLGWARDMRPGRIYLCPRLGRVPA